MATLVNRAYVSTATTGTGTLTLGAAEAGYQDFAAAGVADGDVVPYTIVDGNNWEIGTGTYSSTGPTLSRTPSESSNAGAAINLSGNAKVFVTARAADLQELVTFAETFTLPTVDGTTGQALVTNGSGTLSFADASPTLYAEDPFLATAPSASGANAVAIGDGAVAFGTGSFAVGTDATASSALGDCFAFGLNSSSTGGSSVAFGAGTASGAASIAGVLSTATGDYSLALGITASASNSASTALGANSGLSGSASAGSGSTAIGGSYASGTDSFAAAIANNTSSYGATGANSVAIGYQAKASTGGMGLGYRANAGSTYTTAIGFDANTSATHAVAIGRGAGVTATYGTAVGYAAAAQGSYAIALGFSAQAARTDSVAIGTRSRTAVDGQISFGNGRLTANGDNQASLFILKSDTTDTTPEALTTNNNPTAASTTNQIILPNNSAYSFSGTIIARQQASAGSDYASWEIKGALLRDGSAATTVLGNGIVNKLYATAGASAWAVALTADTTNGGLAITVTGAAATNIRWVATVNTSEVIY